MVRSGAIGLPLTGGGESSRSGLDEHGDPAAISVKSEQLPRHAGDKSPFIAWRRRWIGCAGEWGGEAAVSPDGNGLGNLAMAAGRKGIRPEETQKKERKRK